MRHIEKCQEKILFFSAAFFGRMYRMEFQPSDHSVSFVSNSNQNSTPLL